MQFDKAPALKLGSVEVAVKSRGLQGPLRGDFGRSDSDLPVGASLAAPIAYGGEKGVRVCELRGVLIVFWPWMAAQ